MTNVVVEAEYGVASSVAGVGTTWQEELHSAISENTKTKSPRDSIISLRCLTKCAGVCSSLPTATSLYSIRSTANLYSQDRCKIDAEWESQEL